MARYFIVVIFLVLFCGCQDNTSVTGNYPVNGFATWYNPRLTASGERYRKNELTCALRERDFGKYYLVCNLENNRCIAVKHNDFGPALRLFKRGTIIDLSRHAFSKIADLRKGIVRVRIGEIYSGKAD
ncbi:MAG: septal ring lytic transglycosylase RlpA family protein [Candidatus Omnitrophica bacterium]|nr:septal ring lytic transglycosylase RlpA family protein [Candidatus Omnitrophota bacterium]